MPGQEAAIIFRLSCKPRLVRPLVVSFDDGSVETKAQRRCQEARPGRELGRPSAMHLVRAKVVRALGVLERFGLPLAQLCIILPTSAMNRPGKKRSPAAAESRPARASAASPVVPPRADCGKKWVFRVAAFVGGPLLLLGSLELVLRLAGIGYPTNFLLPIEHNGRSAYIQNNQFGWRFFGRRLSRTPYPFFLSRPKPAGVIRIFVFGESAAKGEPQPRFGVARLLQAILSLRHPEAHFEVVNAAMTAINSHAILPIARDCARAEGDVWVVYMGNNEVVGPFGAGTVFGSQALPLPLIRAVLALKATRVGQMLDSLQRKIRKTDQESLQWGGMRMFLSQRVAADDLRMSGVYKHFQKNLSEILRIGKKAGVGIVVSTVGVNLGDCPPFASAHKEGLSAADRAKWDEAWRVGLGAQSAGKTQEAARAFREAAMIDDHYAELRFRQGQCAMDLRQAVEAQGQFQAACDLDTLRFRCDSRLNQIIRQTASGRESDRILLADTEHVLAEKSPNGVPGEDLFYEHVHLTFEGNYRLASLVAQDVEKLLERRLGKSTGSGTKWPSVAECAQRVAWTEWSQAIALKAIVARMSAPPFTGQLDSGARLEKVQARLQSLMSKPGMVEAAKQATWASLGTAPDDPELFTQLATLDEQTGDEAEAVAAARDAVRLVPSDQGAWNQLGISLARQNDLGAALDAFQTASRLDPTDFTSREAAARLLGSYGKIDLAIQQYRRLLADFPAYAVSWIHLGQLYEQSGRSLEAQKCYQRGLTNSSAGLSDLVEIARFCQERGWYGHAATNYMAAVKLDPRDGALQLGAAQNLFATGRIPEADPYSSEAVRLMPENPTAHLLRGTVLGEQNHPAEAEQQFREALRLNPLSAEAHLDLGISLMTQGHSAAALDEFQQTLLLCPTNALALEYASKLRAQPAAGSTR